MIVAKVFLTAHEGAIGALWCACRTVGEGARNQS